MLLSLPPTLRGCCAAAVALLTQLPEPPKLGPGALALPPDQQLPPLLIITMQMPWYPVSGGRVCVCVSA